MKTLSTAIAFSLTALCANATTVQLDWTTGTYVDPTVDITSVSSVYSVWPSLAVGLYVQDGYEVMQYGDYAYDPIYGPDGAGVLASNNPGIYNTSVRDVIVRSDGQSFSLTSTETTVLANQVYHNFVSDDDFEYVESASFKVGFTGDTSTTLVDPFSYNYQLPFYDMARDTVTTSGFGSASNTTSLTIAGVNSNGDPCDPRSLPYAPLNFQNYMDCSGASGPFNGYREFTLPDGSLAYVGTDRNVGSQNWDWTFAYTPTLTLAGSPSVAAVPVPLGAASMLLAFGGLGYVGRKKRHA